MKLSFIKIPIGVATILACLIQTTSNAQQLPIIEQPIFYAPEYRVYMSATGADASPGDSLTPLATFVTALNKLDSITSGLTGDVYTEVVLFPGRYTEALTQPISKYKIGNKNMNVSVRGIGEVDLDSALVNAGSGMVHLLGSHIKVSNLNILYSDANGVRFGYDYAGTVINPHDIIIENVEVTQTQSHGIIVGIGALNTANPLTLTPPAERFLIKDCYVHHAINFNMDAQQWGSCIKMHNVKHGIIENCLVHDNLGEGIGLDYSEHVIVRNNVVYDNRANIYLDKATDVIIQNNLSYYTHRAASGILLSMEVFSALIADFYIENIYIYNNVILNAPTAISFWQGTVSAIQNAYFSHVYIRHNTIIGKQTNGTGAVSFSYVTAFGQPAGNVHFSNLEFTKNIVSVHLDSISLPLMHGPLNPQPALTSGYNLWSQSNALGYNSLTDRVDSNLVSWVDPADLSAIKPHIDSNYSFVMNAPTDTIVLDDYDGDLRFQDSTNVGAFEVDTTIIIDTITSIDISLNQPKFEIFPNPSNGEFHVTSDEIDLSQSEIRIFGLRGELLSFEAAIHPSLVNIKARNLTGGVYFLSIRNDVDEIVLKLLIE